MGTSVTRTKSATWVVAPPEPGTDVGEVIAACLAAIGEGRADALVRELAGRTVEAARRALATGGDVGAALVAAILDAVGAAASAPVPAPDADAAVIAASLRSHLERGAAASASPTVAAGWVPRVVGSVEGVVEQCGNDADRVGILAATTALMDVGGGLTGRFECSRHGAALAEALDAAATGAVSNGAMAAMRALVGANAAFDEAVALEAAGDHEAAGGELCRARALFLEAGLAVEAAVTLAELARLESEACDAVESALGHYRDARAVLVELDRGIEVARADRDLAFAVAHRDGIAAAARLVDTAVDVFEQHDLGPDLVLCDVVRACLARSGDDEAAVAFHLGCAVQRLRGLGLDERADRLWALARAISSAPE